MVTHDPVAASYADRAVFLADGRIVDDLDAPTADSVLDRIRTSEADHDVPTHAQGVGSSQAAPLTTALRCSSVSPSWPAPSSSPTRSVPPSTPPGRGQRGSRRLRQDSSEIDLGYGARPAARRLARHRRCGRRRRPGGAAHQRVRPARRARRQARRRRARGTRRSAATGSTSPTSTRTSWSAAASGDEIVVDKASADKAGYQPVTWRPCSKSSLGSSRSPASPPSPARTRRRAAGGAVHRRHRHRAARHPGEADAIAVTADPGVSQADLMPSRANAVGDDVEVITGATLIEEDQAAVAEGHRRSP